MTDKKVDKAIKQLVDAVMVLTDAGVLDDIPEIRDLTAKVSEVRCCGPAPSIVEEEVVEAVEDILPAVRDMAAELFSQIYSKMVSTVTVGPFTRTYYPVLDCIALEYVQDNKVITLGWRDKYDNMLYNAGSYGDEAVNMVQKVASTLGIAPLPAYLMDGRPSALGLSFISGHGWSAGPVRNTPHTIGLKTAYKTAMARHYPRMLLTSRGYTYYVETEPHDLKYGVLKQNVVKMRFAPRLMVQARDQFRATIPDDKPFVELPRGYRATPVPFDILAARLVGTRQYQGDYRDGLVHQLAALTAHMSYSNAADEIYRLSRHIASLYAAYGSDKDNAAYQKLIDVAKWERYDILVHIGAPPSIYTRLATLESKVYQDTSLPERVIADMITSELVIIYQELQKRIPVLPQASDIIARDRLHSGRDIRADYVLQLDKAYYAIGSVRTADNTGIGVYLPTWHKIVAPTTLPHPEGSSKMEEIDA